MERFVNKEENLLMSKGKEKELIQLFINKPNNNYTIPQLAKLFNLSERTIRQYIKNINSESEFLIVRNNSGFFQLQTDTTKSVSDENNTYNFTPEQRQIYLINQLLTHKTIDYYFISEELCISLPTIEKDIVKLRSRLKEYQIKLIKTNYELHIQGDESSFRKLSSELIHSETQSKILDLNTISESLKNIDVNTINEVVIQCLENHNLFLNGYTFNSLLLHIAIAIERIQLKQELKNPTIPLHSIKENEEFAVALDIAKALEQEFDISFNINEIISIAILITNVTTKIELKQNKHNDLKNYIDIDTLKLTKDIIRKTEKYYYLPEIDDEFILRISIHINNLINRAKLNQQIHNTLTSSIKQSFPYIYDISVFISNEISKKINHSIYEDEITFISLHIGTYFERAIELQKKLKCMIVFPQYYDFHKDFIYKMERKFSDSFEIIDFILNTNDFNEALLKDQKIDLVISTVHLDNYQNYILVSPFLSKFDIDLINDHIYSMQNAETNSVISEMLKSFMSEELFEKDVYLKNEFEYIDYLGNKLINHNRIDEETLAKIVERENLSSTSFSNNLAIPHAIEIGAKQSSIAVIINQKPIIWGNNPVFIILMLVMKKEQKKEFRQILNYLINSLSDEEKIHKLSKVKDYNDFVTLLTE